MKKFTLMMIALLTVLVVNAAAPVKKVNLQGLRPMVQQNQVPVAMGQVKQAPASLVEKMAARAKAKAKKKAIAAASELEGDYLWAYAQSSSNDADPTAVESEAGSTRAKIAAGSEENTVDISGMFPKVLTGTVDLEKQTITIAAGQDAGSSSYGDYALYGLFYFEGDDTTDAGWYYNNIVGYIQDDGSIAFDDDIWFCRVLTTGSYAGYSLTPYWLPGSTMTPTEPLVPVTPPTGIEAVPYALSYTDDEDNLAGGAAAVIVDGDDVYFQGFSSYVPEGWLKGTKEGNTITVPAGQYYGTYADQYDGELYTDIVFTYDPETESYAAEGEFYTVIGAQYYDIHGFDPVLTKVTEQAATPANPSISGIEETQYGDVVVFNVPLVDTDGNAMLASKVSYVFYKDINREESMVTFSTEDFTKIEEDMTEIPYGFSDSYDFYPTYIYLNMDHSDWNRIGIQSIYRGGDEENKSDIVWYTLSDYPEGLFDFNSMEIATSANGVTDGDITEPFEMQNHGISLTVSPSTTATPNRFWGTAFGPQLRVYGGTLIFKGINRTITGISFEAGKWNDGNSADSGAFDGQDWTGSADQVVVTIAANTQINNIVVTYEEKELAPIEVPDGLTTQACAFTAMAKEYSEDDSEDFEEYLAQVKVGVDGTDVYIQGFAQDMPEAWLKGTLDQVTGTVTIPANQYMGTVTYFTYTFDYFATGVKIQQFGERVDTLLADIVLNMDPMSMTASTDQTIALNESPYDLEYYMLFNNVVIAPMADVAATPADPTVQTFKYARFTYADFVIPATSTDGDPLITDKLYYVIWVEKNGAEEMLTLPAGDYSKLTEDMTEIPYDFDDDYDIYAGGNRVYLNFSDEEMVTWSKIGVQSIYRGGDAENKSNIAWYDLTDVWAATGVKNISTDAATTSVAYYDLQGRRVDNNAKGLVLMQVRKADGTVKTVKVVR